MLGSVQCAYSYLVNASEEALPIETWLPAKDQFLTGAYILSWQGAKWLVDTFSQELWTSDWMTLRLQLRGKSYTYFLWLIIQEGLDSSLRPKGWLDLDHEKVKRLLKSVNYDIVTHYI
jgi:hypothetical protein